MGNLKGKLLLLVLGLCLQAVGCATTSKPVTRGAIPSPEARRSGGFGWFKKSDKKKPIPPRVLIALGKLREDQTQAPKLTTLEKEGLLADAQKAYSQALEQTPDNVEGYLGLGRVHAKLQEYPRAFEMYKEALKKHPQNAKVWYDYGMTNCRAKNFDLAISCFRKAEKANPNDRSITATLGHCLARAGRASEALDVLIRIQGPAQAHYNVARMLKHTHRYEEAKQHAILALRHDRQMSEAQALLATLNNESPQPNHLFRQEATSNNATFPIPPHSLQLGQPGA
ncbi:MAG: tetratricopeptide repeat protein [Gemmataceae bacterium]